MALRAADATASHGDSARLTPDNQTNHIAITATSNHIAVRRNFNGLISVVTLRPLVHTGIEVAHSGLMEIRDGFIVSIFNYCDRWCETCAFTSRCRLFADMAEHEAELDPNLQAVVHAPPLPQHIPPPPPKWVEALIDKMNDLMSKPLTQEELALAEPRIAPEHKEIHERARAYCHWVLDWLNERDRIGRDNSNDPVSVIAWFATLNSSKIYRALAGLADEDGDREFPPDHEGSAKVALIGIERSHAAWLRLVADGRVTESTARPCISELEWLRDRLDSVFPQARAFVRPGFDEPEAVAQLD